MDDEEIDYKTLRKIQELEKNSPVLTELKSYFYVKLNKYLQNLENRLKSESSQQKKILLKDEIQNIKKIATNIYEQREKKIILGAITKVRGGNPDLSKLIDIEEDLFNSVLNEMINSRKKFLEYKKEKFVEPESSKKFEKEKDDKIQQEPSEKEHNLKEKNINPIVRITENIPEFIGTDEKKYNLRNNDIVSIPEDMSDMLVGRGVAKKINHK